MADRRFRDLYEFICAALGAQLPISDRNFKDHQGSPVGIALSLGEIRSSFPSPLGEQSLRQPTLQEAA
jgi:hypothetical protein